VTQNLLFCVARSIVSGWNPWFSRTRNNRCQQGPGVKAITELFIDGDTSAIDRYAARAFHQASPPEPQIRNPPATAGARLG